jgi:Mg2+ and Co2+ transporter CorA
MDKVTNHDGISRNASAAKTEPKSEILLFNDLDSFSKAVEARAGLALDFASVTGLNTDFLESSEKYLLLNVKDSGSDEPNNLLFLTEDKAFLFAKRHPPQEKAKAFQRVLPRRFGASTILAYLTLDKVLESYKQQLEAFIGAIEELEESFESKKYRDLTFEFLRLNDRLEEFHDLLLKLQERSYKEVQTRYISFDYSVLIAESLSLQDRCQRRFNMLKDLERDNEMRLTTELNKRIEKLNDVVKKLTAITVILMLPTLIASHFGMNFAFMPELKVWWTYPTVIAVQFVLMGVGLFWFRKIDWL